jgi:hypothetical protein
MADGARSLVAEGNGAGASSASLLRQPGDNWSKLRWELHSFVVQATDSNTTLGFLIASSTDAAAGPFVDAISATAVPEPAGLAWWVAGLDPVAGVARRRGCGRRRVAPQSAAGARPYSRTSSASRPACQG